MAADEELTPEHKETVSFGARIIALKPPQPRGSDMTTDEELTPERREMLSLGARIIALENANLALSIVVGVLARAVHGLDLEQVVSAVREQYEGPAEREDFAAGLTEAERHFLADQIRGRLAAALKPLENPEDNSLQS
jgi:hypothetical protein